MAVKRHKGGCQRRTTEPAGRISPLYRAHFCQGGLNSLINWSLSIFVTNGYSFLNISSV